MRVVDLPAGGGGGEDLKWTRGIGVVLFDGGLAVHGVGEASLVRVEARRERGISGSSSSSGSAGGRLGAAKDGARSWMGLVSSRGSEAAGGSGRGDSRGSGLGAFHAAGGVHVAGAAGGAAGDSWSADKGLIGGLSGSAFRN